MAFSSGTFTIDTSGTPYVTGTTISSSVVNAVNTEIATGLTTCITKDGTQTTTAAIPFAAGLTSTSGTFSTTLAVTGITTHGGNVVSDTDSTDDLGTTGVRWANAYIDSVEITDAIELGHATDTSLTRASAGDVNVEGNIIYRAGGTDVPAADGGTGRSSHTAYAVLCGGTTSTAAQQSIASVGTAAQVLTSNGAGALPTFQANQSITLGTEQDATNGGSDDLTVIDFTGIPAGTKRITIMLIGVSLSGTSLPLIQLGDAGGIETSGYSGWAGLGSGSSNVNMSAGFDWNGSSPAASVYHGFFTLQLEDSSDFTWAESHTIGKSNTSDGGHGAGSKSLSAELTQVRLTATNGSDTFDGGVINISYE